MPKFRLETNLKKFRTFLSLLFLILLVSSCDEGCVRSYQFDSETTYVNSKPVADGISGSIYDDTSGGQIALWHKTGVITNGEEMILGIRGNWTSWDSATNKTDLERMKECTMCAKKSVGDNCICDSGQTPESEKDSMGDSLGIDCSDSAAGIVNQADPAKCTCSKQNGNIGDQGVYFIALDYQNKNETLKIADEQDACRFTRGFGLYVGLFGSNELTLPLRVYQTYPTEELCEVRRIAGKCVNSSGEDQTKYIYRSPNHKIFIKDDKSGNNGTDADPSNDEYHKYGEYVKLIINDRYYSDNYGGYDVEFMGGVVKKNDTGLLEYIVSTVEDILLGKVSSNGKRVGGIIEYTYNSIVKDTIFILIIQLCLVFYVVLFGIWVVSGSLAISKADLSKRIIKIALVALFTTENSWYFYNQFVVGMFKDGMDSIITIFMAATDKTLDHTALMITSEIGRENITSYSTRFFYVDNTIKMLFSSGVSRKIWSLVFGDLFGIFYVIALYMLIFFFVYVVLMVALAYIKILLGLIFMLCLGPIFIITVLFNKTDEIFKRWISYMVSQAIQIICLFLVLYLFVVLINKNFIEILSYGACTTNINFGLFNINFLKSDISRPLVVWSIMFIKLGALIMLLKIVLEKIPGLTGRLISIMGQAVDASAGWASGANAGAFSLATDLLGRGKKYFNNIPGYGGSVANLVSYSASRVADVGRLTGLNNVATKLRNGILDINYKPTIYGRGIDLNLATAYRNYKIDSLISAAKKAAIKDKKDGAELDQVVRESVMNQVHNLSFRNSIFGINDSKIIEQRLENALVRNPLKKAIKDEITKIKEDSGIPLGKEAMHEALKPRIEEWARDHSVVDSKKVAKLMEEAGYQSLIEKHGELTSSEAAKAFAGKDDEKDRYLKYLQEKKNFKYDATGKNFMSKVKTEEKYKDSSYLSKLYEQNAIRRTWNRYGSLTKNSYLADQLNEAEMSAMAKEKAVMDAAREQEEKDNLKKEISDFNKQKDALTDPFDTDLNDKIQEVADSGNVLSSLLDKSNDINNNSKDLDYQQQLAKDIKQATAKYNKFKEKLKAHLKGKELEALEQELAKEQKEHPDEVNSAKISKAEALKREIEDSNERAAAAEEEENDL